MSHLSARDVLDMTYSTLVDGTAVQVGAFEAKQHLDQQLLMVYPDPDSWGVDADELDSIPSAYDIAGQEAGGTVG